MVKRLLNALEYPQTDLDYLNNENNFRKLIVWLETNKIKKCNANLITSLKNINSNDWPQYFEQYKQQLGCPKFENHQEDIQWLLGLAVQIESHNHSVIYMKHAVKNLKTISTPNVIAENPLDKLDFRSKEFADGINNVAVLLKMTPHTDPLITLKAVCKLVTKRLTPAAIEHPENIIIKGTPFPVQETDLGFDLKDPVLNQAAKILRILYIHDLRELQTRANELIVAVQNVTANPKTDTKLGKVGK